MGEIRRFAIADACSVYGESLRTKPSVAASASIVRERKEMTGLITTPAAPPPNRFGVRTTLRWRNRDSNSSGCRIGPSQSGCGAAAGRRRPHNHHCHGALALWRVNKLSVPFEMMLVEGSI